MTEAPRKRRRVSSKNKGNTFERELCKLLSLWWSNQDTDDIFWRSASSGGRATSRTKQGKSTTGQYGDIAATDPIGKPLIDFLTIELKRGYNKDTMHDVLDRKERMAVQPFEKLVIQAARSSTEAKSYAWLLVTRRDARHCMVWMPAKLLRALQLVIPDWKRPSPFVRAEIHVTTSFHGETIKMVGFHFDVFVQQVRPRDIKKLHRWWLQDAEVLPR